jgi:hypothetical protein
MRVLAFRSCKAWSLCALAVGLAGAVEADSPARGQIPTTAAADDREIEPGMLLPGSGARIEMGLPGLVAESMFGNPNDPWRPLSLRTFFTEGWFEPWDYPPPAPAAPRGRAGSMG